MKAQDTTRRSRSRIPSTSRAFADSAIRPATGTIRLGFGRFLAALIAVLLFPAAGWAQEISVRGGPGLDVFIADGDTSPRAADGTSFGTTNVTGGAIEKTFRIRNLQNSDGFPFTGDLTTSISENSSHFSITAAPILPIGEESFADFTVRFDPTSAGTKNATVTIVNNDSNENPYTFSITGVGQGFPEISVFGLPSLISDGTPISDGDTSPRTADGTEYGTVDALGLDKVNTFRVKNTGTAPLTVSMSDNSTNFFISGAASSVAVNSFDDFTITYNPQSSGTHSATITITNNDSNENPYTFTVRGTARAPEIQVQGGASLNVNIADGDTTPNTTDRTDFGSRDIAAGPLDRTFRIRNTQGSDGIPFTGDLVISSISDNSSQWSILNAPLLPIGEASFADFTVRFDPTSAGTKNATITIQNNDPDGGEGTFTFAVTGVGTASSEISVFGLPSLISDGTAIPDGDTTPRTADGTNFGDVYVGAPKTNTYRIKNTGSGTLTVALSDDSTRFGFSSTVSSIAPGAFDDFNITFTPIVSGTVFANITITNNDPDGGENPYTFRVQGTGRAPEIAVRGGPGLNVNIADGDSTPTTTDGTDFGSADILTGAVNKTFRIFNLESSDGLPLTGDLFISSITEGSGHFSIVSSPLLPIGEGGFADFTVRFDPTSVGTKSTTITIDNNDPDDGEDPYTFTITGVGTGEPEISVFGLPNLISDGVLLFDGATATSAGNGTDFGDFDMLGILPNVVHAFRVRNTGALPLTVSVTDNSNAFRTSGLVASVPGGGFDDFDIIFDPPASGTFTATITITNNDANENPFTFRVTGTGRAPEIAVRGGPAFDLNIADGDLTPRTEDGTDFGSADITGGAVEKTFRIFNLQSSDGIPLTGDLIISSISEGSDQFSIVAGPILPIGESSSADFTVRFDPSDLGTHTATVTIVHNDPDDGEAPYNFRITGVGTGEPEIEVFGLPNLLSDGVSIRTRDTSPATADGTDFGKGDVLALLDTTHSFRVKNTGTAPMTVSVSENSSQFQITEPLNATIAPGGFDDFNITFNPTSSGVKDATVTITNNDPDGGESPFTFAITGLGTAPEIAVRGGPGLNIEIGDGDLTPSTADGTDFGSADLTGGAVEKTFRIFNLQSSDGIPLTGDLIISSITEGSDHFAIVAGPILPIGEASFADFTVRFDPSDLGTHTATITIVHNDPDDGESPFNFRITGEGTGEPEIEVYGLPNLLSDGTEIFNGDNSPRTADGTDYGNADVLGLIDPTHTFRVKNTGTAPMTVSVSEDSIQYQITETLNATIPPGGFDDFNITFNPQSSGNHSATVTITNNDPDGGEAPFVYSITGAAFAPEITVDGGPALNLDIPDGDTTPRIEDGTDFGEASVTSGAVEKTFRISNVASSDGIPFTGDLTISDIQVSNSAHYSIVSGAPLPLLPIFIGQGNTHDFTVRFDPDDVDVQNAIVRITNNDPDGGEGTYTFAITGVGLGESEIQVFGQPILLISDGVPIANGDVTPDQADGTDFGDVDALALIDASRTYRIKNTGTAPLTVSVTEDSAEYQITEPLNASIPPNGGFDDFTITFNPQSSGIHSATVTIVNDDPDGGENPYTFEISGRAFAPEISVRGGPAGDVFIGNGDTTPRLEDGTIMRGVPVLDTSEKTFRIDNLVASDGIPFTGDLAVSEISVSNPSVFSISAGSPLPLIPILVGQGNFHEFTIRFAPTVAGTFSGTVTIRHNDPDGDEDPYTFRIEATGGNPDIHLSHNPAGPGNLIEIANGAMDPQVANGTDFGSHLLSDDPFVSRDFQVVNVGGSDLTMSVSVNSPEFLASPIVDRVVNPNLALGFNVVFHPSSEGTHEATVTITSNDPDEDPYTFKVRGTALAPEIDVLGGPALDVVIDDGDTTPDTTDRTEFGEAEVGGTPVTHTFRLTNPGSLELLLSGLSDDSDQFETVGLPATLAAGASADITVTFAPTSTGTKTATITILSNDGDESPYTFVVQGNGTEAPADDKIATSFSFPRGGTSGALNFQSEPGKSYRIVTTTNLEVWDEIPELTGITGTGDLVGVDLTPWLPSATNRTRFFRVEEE